MLFTLYVCKLSTTHINTASLPTGIVIFCSLSPNFGVSVKIAKAKVKKERKKKKKNVKVFHVYLEEFNSYIKKLMIY